jgi:hypothetical protein
VAVTAGMDMYAVNKTYGGAKKDRWRHLPLPS